MSLFAILPAARDIIRTGLSLDASQCRVRADAKPPPGCGDLFISVFGTSWAPGDPDLNRGLDEFFGIGVAVTQRMGWVQDEDRAEEIFIKQATGLENYVRKINTLLHQSIPLMTTANKYIANDANQIIEPLRFVSADASPSLVGPEWFGADTISKNPRDNQVVGMVLQTNFDRARRTQTYENMR